MTKCPECGHDVSDIAISCPSCGLPLGAPVDASIPPIGAQYTQPYPIFEPPRKTIGPLTVIVIIFTILVTIVIVLAAILYPIFASAKSAAKRTATLTNVKQVGNGLALYLSDNDDVYPMRLRTNNDLREFTMPYTKNEAAFVSANPNGGDILPNSRLEKLSFTEIVDQNNTVAVFEEMQWSQGGKCYGFVDTHVKFLRSEDRITFDPKKKVSK